MHNPWYVYMGVEEAKHYLEHTMKYLEMEVKRNASNSFGTFINKTVIGLPIIVLKIFLKSTYNYLRYGFKRSMPVSVEFGRISYIMVLMYRNILARFKA